MKPQTVAVPLTRDDVKRLLQALIHSQDHMAANPNYGGKTVEEYKRDDRSITERLEAAKEIFDAEDRIRWATERLSAGAQKEPRP